MDIRAGPFSGGGLNMLSNKTIVSAVGHLVLILAGLFSASRTYAQKLCFVAVSEKTEFKLSANDKVKLAAVAGPIAQFWVETTQFVGPPVVITPSNSAARPADKSATAGSNFWTWAMLQGAAIQLLTAAPSSYGIEDPSVQQWQAWASLRLAMQELAIKWEILDRRELKYILARPEDFASDLNLLRRRWQDLRFAPALCDCVRFPERATVNDLLAFNRAYRQHIDVRQPVELTHWWELRVALEETERLYKIWDSLRDARCDYYYVAVRRQALKRLREQIGEEAYYNGDLPPCVPLWRFSMVK
jgi:hypothetical protein